MIKTMNAIWNWFAVNANVSVSVLALLFESRRHDMMARVQANCNPESPKVFTAPTISLIRNVPAWCAVSNFVVRSLCSHGYDAKSLSDPYPFSEFHFEPSRGSSWLINGQPLRGWAIALPDLRFKLSCKTKPISISNKTFCENYAGCTPDVLMQGRPNQAKARQGKVS